MTAKRLLKPCPFCGASEWMPSVTMSNWIVLFHKEGCWLDGEQRKIGRSATCIGPDEVEAWNNRSKEQPP